MVHNFGNQTLKLKPRTAFDPWSNGKVENVMKHLQRYMRSYLNDNASNWSESAKQFAFAANTTVISRIGKTPYEILFGNKPQIPVSLKLGILRDENQLCRAETNSFCERLPEHQHEIIDSQNEGARRLLKPKLTSETLAREQTLHRIYKQVYEYALEDFHKYYESRNIHKNAKQLDKKTPVFPNELHKLVTPRYSLIGDTHMYIYQKNTFHVSLWMG